MAEESEIFHKINLLFSKTGILSTEVAVIKTQMDPIPKALDDIRKCIEKINVRTSKLEQTKTLAIGFKMGAAWVIGAGAVLFMSLIAYLITKLTGIPLSKGL